MDVYTDRRKDGKPKSMSPPPSPFYKKRGTLKMSLLFLNMCMHAGRTADPLKATTNLFYKMGEMTLGLINLLISCLWSGPPGMSINFLGSSTSDFALC